MRDVNDNAVIVCSIENVDAMGVHTGDSITVAPAQTLTDREYQAMRDASIAILREIGVETGGSNVQFAVNPDERPHGRHRDEPARVALAARWRPRRPASRSPRSRPSSPSATRSTRSTTTSRARRRRASSRASTTPWSRCRAGRSRSSRGTDETLTTRMKSVGEAMAIGRTFEEALGKAFRSLENGRVGPGRRRPGRLRREQVRRAPRRAQRAAALLRRRGVPPRPHRRGRLRAHADRPVVPARHRAASSTAEERAARPRARRARAPTSCAGPSARASPTRRSRTSPASTEAEVRAVRKALGVRPTFKSVDTCAAEFAASTPYYYKTYEDEDEVAPVATGPRR